MIVYKEGICCTCQSKVPIDASSIPRQEEYAIGHDDDDIELTYGQGPSVIDYICVSHTFYGQHCEGSGQIPQCFVTHQGL